MKLGKLFAVAAIITATSVFGATLKSIDTLVDQINTSKDQKVKNKLMDQLDYELQTIDQKDLAKAQEIVNAKLKVAKALAK